MLNGGEVPLKADNSNKTLLKKVTNKQVYEQLQVVEKLWNNYYSLIDQYLLNNNPEDLNKIITGNPAIVSESDKAVVMFEKISNKKLKQLNTISIFGVILSLIAFGFSLQFARSIVKDILRFKETFNYGSQGDLTKTVTINASDELGSLANSYNSFIDNIKSIIQTLRTVSVSNKNLGTELSFSTQTVATSTEEIAAMMTSIEMKNNQLNDEIIKSNATVNEVKKYISTVNNQISDQTAAVTESSASIEEMVANIQNISRIAQDRISLIKNLTDTATHGEQDMEETLSAIVEISKSAGAILEMIAVINNVASQTDLLAMNAAIEAAHAGDAGKGFAVVADEIRKLAETTAGNAKMISKSLNDVISKIQSTTEITNRTGETIRQMTTSIGDVSSSMTEIINGMNELSIGSNQILQALHNQVSITENLRDSSKEMFSRTDNIEKSMQNVTELSSTNVHSIKDMTSGVHEIMNSMIRITDMGTENASNTTKLEVEVNKFIV